MRTIRIILPIRFWIKQLMKNLVARLLVTGTLALPAFVAADVNVYSYRQAYLIDPVFEAFTEETGIKVNTIFAKKGLIERLRREGRNSPADLLLTTDSGPLNLAMSGGLTRSVESELLNSRIQPEFRDPNGHWFGMSSRARIIVTSKDRVKEGEVSSYEDLAKPELKGKVCTRSGKHTYMIALTASIIAHSGEEATRDWLQGVKNNLARKPQGNDRAQVKAIKEGECDIAVINSYYMGSMLADDEQQHWANAVNVIYPNQSDRGTHMNISGVSLTAASPNRDEAIRLIEFLADTKAQQVYAEQNHEFPVNATVAPSALVASWGEFTGDTLSLAEIAKHRATAAKIADQVGYDQ